MTNLRSNVIWSAVRNWGTRLGSIAIFLVLVRILDKEQIGIVSAALAIIAIAELFSENGLGDAVVQTPEIDDSLLSGVLLINLGLALMVSLILLSISPWLEGYFDAPGLSPLLAVTLLSLILNAASYVPQAVLRRRFEYKWLGVRALIATIVSGATGIVLAILGFGAWSMIAQAVLFALINFLVVWAYPPFAWARPAFGRAFALVRFSASLLGQRVLYTVCSRVIELVILHRFGPAVLSMYIIGSRIYFVSTQLLTAVVIDVAFSSFSRLSENLVALRASFVSMTRTAAAIAVPVFLGLAATAQELCAFAFGDKGHEAFPFLLTVALFGPLQVAGSLFASALSAIGRPASALAVLALQAGTASIILFGPWGLSPVALVAANQATIALVWPIYLVVYARAVNQPVRELLGVILPIFACGAAMFGVIELMRIPMVATIPNHSLRLFVFAGIGAVVYVTALRLIARDTLKALWAMRRSSGAPAQS